MKYKIKDWDIDGCISKISCNSNIGGNSVGAVCRD